MASLWLLFTCLALGFIMRRLAQPPAHLAPSLNWWVIHIALPALILDWMPRIQLDTHLWFLVVSQWLIFALTWLGFAYLGRQLNWSRARTGAVILMAGLGNTSFLGYPLIEALRGSQALPLAVVTDQIGCFVMLATGGMVLTAVYGGRQLQPTAAIQQMLLFPPFLALISGLGVGWLGGWPQPVHEVLARIGSALSPVALFSVGLQLQLHLDRPQRLALVCGLASKLLAAPLLCYVLGGSLGVSGLVLTVAVLQAAMAPMISAAILADQYGLEPRLANNLLGVGIVLSLLTVPLIDKLL